MIRHFAFFETIGMLDEKSVERIPVFAGLAVLRLVDRAVEEADAAGPEAGPEYLSTRRAVEAMRVGDPARAILHRVVDRISKEARLSAELGADLLSYGRALDLEARWSLAADAFGSVATMFSESQHPRLVIEAATALGAAARNAGDWKTSETGYARAEHLAASSGEDELELIARVGMATSHMVRGNLPTAETEIEEILKEAELRGTERAKAVALHARASVAHSRGDYRQAVHFGYRSLELTTNPGSRDRVVADLAAAYAGLGMKEVARDAYSIVAMTSPHQSVRWQATLNLMELSIDEGDEPGVASYMKELDSMALDPRLRAYFLLLRARASRQFGHADFSSRFEIAREYAQKHRLHQFAFHADQAMAAAEDLKSSVEKLNNPLEPSDEVVRIARELVGLRSRAPSIFEQNSGEVRG